MTVTELNYTDEKRKETAQRLGLSEAQLETIYKQIKETKPLYHYGYDWQEAVFLTALTVKINRNASVLSNAENLKRYQKRCTKNARSNGLCVLRSLNEPALIFIEE